MIARYALFETSGPIGREAVNGRGRIPSDERIRLLPRSGETTGRYHLIGNLSPCRPLDLRRRFSPCPPQPRDGNSAEDSLVETHVQPEGLVPPPAPRDASPVRWRGSVRKGFGSRAWPQRERRSAGPARSA